MDDRVRIALGFIRRLEDDSQFFDDAFFFTIDVDDLDPRSRQPRREMGDEAADGAGADHGDPVADPGGGVRSEEHTSELQSLMRISYAVLCLKHKRKEHRLQRKINNKTIIKRYI